MQSEINGVLVNVFRGFRGSRDIDYYTVMVTHNKWGVVAEELLKMGLQYKTKTPSTMLDDDDEILDESPEIEEEDLVAVITKAKGLGVFHGIRKIEKLPIFDAAISYPMIELLHTDCVEASALNEHLIVTRQPNSSDEAVDGIDPIYMIHTTRYTYTLSVATEEITENLKSKWLLAADTEFILEIDKFSPPDLSQYQ